jgi:hypothetical protein
MVKSDDCVGRKDMLGEKETNGVNDIHNHNHSTNPKLEDLLDQ